VPGGDECICGQFERNSLFFSLWVAKRETQKPSSLCQFEGTKSHDPITYPSLFSDRLAGYLAEIQADVANSSAIDGGLKKGIEYRLPSGCIVELDALYSGALIGPLVDFSLGASKQPTEDDCCRACQ